jgi:hypothetical protein
MSKAHLDVPVIVAAIGCGCLRVGVWSRERVAVWYLKIGVVPLVASGVAIGLCTIHGL